GVDIAQFAVSDGQVALHLFVPRSHLEQLFEPFPGFRILPASRLRSTRLEIDIAELLVRHRDVALAASAVRLRLCQAQIQRQGLFKCLPGAWSLPHPEAYVAQMTVSGGDFQLSIRIARMDGEYELPNLNRVLEKLAGGSGVAPLDFNLAQKFIAAHQVQ